MSFEEAALMAMTESEVRADERERIAAMVEALPPVTAFKVLNGVFTRPNTPAEIAAKIREAT